jgi:signal transduction histidine kinase
LDLSQDIALDELAARAVERFETQTTQHKFVIDFPQPFPLIEADAARLRQVFDNLIGNAIKYSPQGGVIRVAGHYDRHKVTVAVQDEGVGLSERDKERVFDRFFRVDSKLSRRTQGTGLGLYLAKAIVEAHHGAIGVESALGKGSTFYFSIPVRQPSTDGAD